VNELFSPGGMFTPWGKLILGDKLMLLKTGIGDALTPANQISVKVFSAVTVHRSAS
jgi:hypothetical protein